MTATTYSLSSPPKYPTDFNAREKKLLEAARQDVNIADTFAQALTASAYTQAGAAYTGATAETIGFDSGRAPYEWHQAAVAVAAVIAPYQSTDGLVMKPVADGDAFELTNGTTSLSRCARTVGTSKAFYAQATFKIPDISGITELWFGWRKAEAYQADSDNYDELASLNIGLGATGRINITTILNNAATSTTNTALTALVDGDSVTLRVEVDALGRCTFKVNGTATTVAAFKFDSGEVVVPFCWVDTHADGPDLTCSNWTVGRL